MPSARERPDPALVATIRELLDRIGAAQGRENDEVLLLSARDPEPETIEVMRTWITDPSPEVRSVIIQTIGVDELRALAPLACSEPLPERPRAFTTLWGSGPWPRGGSDPRWDSVARTVAHPWANRIVER
jgi:hypothetical protein